MIGLILGSAFDRAIGLALRNWRIVISVWIVLSCAYILDRTPNQIFVSVLWIAWIPIPAILAARSLSDGFSIRASSLARFYVVSLLLFAATLGLVATFGAILIPGFLHARETGRSGIVLDVGIIASMLGGLAVSVWLGIKWSLAPAITLYRSCPIAASFGDSWALTKGKFWQTLVFNAAAALAYAAVGLVPMTLTTAIATAYHFDEAWFELLASHYLPALVVPVLVYGGIAEWIAYFRWLEWLESTRVLTPRDAV
jgi:hypothetical protein